MARISVTFAFAFAVAFAVAFVAVVIEKFLKCVLRLVSVIYHLVTHECILRDYVDCTLVCVALASPTRERDRRGWVVEAKGIEFVGRCLARNSSFRLVFSTL